MKDWKKILKRVVAGGIAASCICGLSGCVVYTKDDLATYTKKRLEEEYGEKFEIKTVIDDSNTIAYPVNNPQLLFETSYVISNGNGYNKYLHEIVAQQFKELVEEKMADFKYKYYIDIDLGLSSILNETEGVGTDVTIEEFDKLTEILPSNRPTYRIFMLSEALNYSDEELYQLFESIASIHNCFIDIYFLKDEYYGEIMDNFSKYPRIVSSDLYDDLQYKFGSIGLAAIKDGNGKLKKDFTEFSELMRGVRNNVYR